MKKLMLTIVTLAATTSVLFASDDEPYLAENLSVWLRADKGLTTNAVGGVTAWANQGTKGASVDVAPHADNSDGHIAYEASGISGKPSLLFDGNVYLKTSAATDLGVTANGGAWFVVFKTPCTRAERINMGIMGSVPGQRFGAFFTNDGNENARCYFFKDIGTVTVTSNTTQIVSSMCWKEDSATREYPMNLWATGSVTTGGISPGSAVFMVGNMVPSWMPTFKGEIAEVRIYNRALTGRERTRIQLELAARYGVQWQGLGYVNNGAMQYYANSVILDGVSNDGVPEEIVSSGETGGLSLSLDNPSAMNEANAYLTHDDNEGLARRWYLSAWSKTRSGSGLTLAFDLPASFADAGLNLLYMADGWTAWGKVNATGAYENGRLIFHLPANTWGNWWYRLGFPTLSAWYRADVGVVTNAAGKIETWKNIGVGASAHLDLAPTNDATTAVLVPDAVNGLPAANFDGQGFLKSESQNNFANWVTKPNATDPNDKYNRGAAWFVVFKPCATVSERVNMSPFMLPNPGNGSQRCGLFFDAGGGGRRLQSYLYDEGQNTTYATAFDGWQITSYARWTRASDFAARGQVFASGAASGVGVITKQPWNAYIYLGFMGLDWAPPFKGDIAELRIYNAPLTANERALTEIELATHYGISVTTAGINGIPPPDYQNDAQIFNGKFAESADAAPTNAVSGELTLTCLDAIDQTPAQVTFVGHDDSAWFPVARAKDRAPRSWFVSSGAPNQAYRLEFADVNIAQGSCIKLLYRPDLESEWQQVSISSGDATFDVASLQRGFYTLEVTPGGLCISIR